MGEYLQMLHPVRYIFGQWLWLEVQGALPSYILGKCVLNFSFIQLLHLKQSFTWYLLHHLI